MLKIRPFKKASKKKGGIMKFRIITTGLLTACTSMASAGGYEAQVLDTSFMHEKGSMVSVSTASLNSSHTLSTGTKAKILKDQSFVNLTVKSKFGPVDVGLTNYRSGAIQLSGSANAGGVPNWVPTADADVDTITVMAKYDFGNDISVLAGINRDSLGTSKITTPAGLYDIKSSSAFGYVIGAAYSYPDIALRAELIYQTGSDLGTTTTYTGGAVVPNVTTSLKRPETLTFNFQSGVTENTLLYGSVHNATWTGAPITVGTLATLGQAKIDESFSNSSKYTVGVGRKFNESISATLSYATESGSGATDTSLFTVSNGSNTIGVGMRYTINDTSSVSVGYGRTTFGDVDLSATYPTTTYVGNTADTFGVKFQVSY